MQIHGGGASRVFCEEVTYSEMCSMITTAKGNAPLLTANKRTGSQLLVYSRLAVYG